MGQIVSQKIVLFDFDGVIVNTFELCLGLGQRMYPDLNPDSYRDFSNGNIYDLIAEREKVKPRVEHFDYFTEYTPKLMKHAPVKGIGAVLHALAGKHPLIIVSSTIESPIQDYLSMHNLSKYFAEILGSDHEKSKAKKIRDVLARYKVKPQDVVFVTDTLGDIREALVAGVKTVGVTWGWHPRATLMKGSPDAIVERPDLLLAAIESQLA